MQSPPAGWYPDPDELTELRFWDGDEWDRPELVAQAEEAARAERAAALATLHDAWVIDLTGPTPTVVTHDPAQRRAGFDGAVRPKVVAPHGTYRRGLLAGLALGARAMLVLSAIVFALLAAGVVLALGDVQEQLLTSSVVAAAPGRAWVPGELLTRWVPVGALVAVVCWQLATMQQLKALGRDPGNAVLAVVAWVVPVVNLWWPRAVLLRLFREAGRETADLQKPTTLDGWWLGWVGSHAGLAVAGALASSVFVAFAVVSVPFVLAGMAITALLGAGVVQEIATKVDDLAAEAGVAP